MNSNDRGNSKNKISVTYMSGPLDGKKLVFDQPQVGSQRILTIGRRDGCDVHIDFDNQVSRIHARLGCAAVPVTESADYITKSYVLSFWLEDNSSRNGTFVEKSPHPIKERASLRPGTLFRIGRTWVRLDIPLSFDQ